MDAGDNEFTVRLHKQASVPEKKLRTEFTDGFHSDIEEVVYHISQGVNVLLSLSNLGAQ